MKIKTILQEKSENGENHLVIKVKLKGIPSYFSIIFQDCEDVNTYH